MELLPAAGACFVGSHNLTGEQSDNVQTHPSGPVPVSIRPSRRARRGAQTQPILNPGELSNEKHSNVNSKIVACWALLIRNRDRHCTASRLFQKGTGDSNGANHTDGTPPQSHRIEVVFVLDTTSSMSGLIQAAKEKIWSIATTMGFGAAKSRYQAWGWSPFAIVAMLTSRRTYSTCRNDLDSMYASLMDFRAQGGGDGPESVNQALYDAIHKVSWSNDSNVYRAVFLVGDAPPHMNYHNDVKYPVTLAAAANKGIVVNAIQSGQHQYTRPAWQEIASLGHGEYFQVENSGNAVAVATPFDEKLSRLAAELEDTRLFFGDEETKVAQKAKLDANADCAESCLRKHSPAATLSMPPTAVRQICSVRANWWMRLPQGAFHLTPSRKKTCRPACRLWRRRSKWK